MWRSARSQSSSKAAVESASPGSPSAAAAAERPQGMVPAELTLRTGPDKPSGPVDNALYISVLKELIGPEIREVIRAELTSAIAHSPSGHASLSGGQPRPKERLMAEAETPAALSAHAAPPKVVAPSEEGGPPTPESEVGMTEPLLQKEQDDAERRPSNASNELVLEPQQHSSTNANARHEMTSDMKRTGTYLYDLSMAKRLDVIEAEANDRIEAEELIREFPSFEHCIRRLDGIFGQIGNDAPKCDDNSFAWIADSCWFGTVGNFVTLLNCAFLTYLANWEFEHYKNQIPGIVFYIDLAFLIFFSFELAVRLGYYRWYYFFDINYRMNWLDFIIVVSGVIDHLADIRSLLFLRHLRTLRLLKVLRVVRILRMFKTLRVVLESLSNTMTELVWCAITLLLIQYMFALMLVMHTGEFLHEYCRREGSEILTQKEIDDLRQAFGSVSEAMLSLFTISMGAGDWAEHYHILSPTGLFTQMIYLVFVTFSFIAVLNVILGIFVDKAMRNLEPTKEEQAREHAEEEIQTVNELVALCKEGDLDGKGELSPQEWHDMFTKGKIVSYLDLRGFRSHDLRAFFDVSSAQSESGNVDIEAFVRGCMRLKGPSTCFDVQTLLVEVQQVNQRIRELQEHVGVQPAHKTSRRRLKA